MKMKYSYKIPNNFDSERCRTYGHFTLLYQNIFNIIHSNICWLRDFVAFVFAKFSCGKERVRTAGEKNRRKAMKTKIELSVEDGPLQGNLIHEHELCIPKVV